MICNAPDTISYIFSNWVPGWLPINYEIATNKWPVNNFDITDIFASISDSNGFAQVDFAVVNETYLNKEYIQISGASVTGYNGVWQILQKNSSTSFVISAPYLGNDSANWVRYYQGYNIKVNVYTGIPSGHTLESNDPMALAASIKTKPGLNGVATIDVSSVVRTKLSPIQNDLCTVLGTGNYHGNDYKLWTAFYIEYAESYLQSDGTTVSEFTSDYETDTLSYETNYFYATNSALQFQDSQGRSVGRFVIGDTDPDTVAASFMTTYEVPTYFLDKEFDLAIGIGFSNAELAAAGFAFEYVLTEYDNTGTQIAQDISPVEQSDQGIYRFAFSEYPLNGSTDYFTFYIRRSTGETATEIKRVNVDRVSCKFNGDIYLRWANIYGAFDGWWFNRNHDYIVNVSERQTIRRNIYKNFDDTFTTGDTQDDYYHTTAKEKVLVRSDWMSKTNVDQMKWLRTSNKVYLCFTTTEEGCVRYKKRTVLIDAGEFVLRSDKNNLNKITFTFEYTDEMILPGQ